MKAKHIEIPTTRRQFLCRSGVVLALALASLLRNESVGNEPTVTLPGAAKRVIFLFMEGGPSHIDLFDPKPLINELADNRCLKVSAM